VRRLLALALLLLLRPAPAGAQPAPAPPAEGPDAILLLVGDAGDPDRRGEPVMRALRAEAEKDPTRTVVVFLGDNIYPRGLPAPAAADRPEAERRITAQLEAVRVPGLRAIFVPGNHDWDAERADGWNAVRRQGAFVQEHAAPGTEFLPKGGCPGPEIRDVGERVRLVLMDTQWFLHAFDKPAGPEGGCAAPTEQAVAAAMAAAVTTAGTRDVLFASHHPLDTGGPHGGRFSTRQHVFPLTDWKPWLWIPLPGIGSIYPEARKRGASPQDMSSTENQQMRALFDKALGEHPPLAWIGGHEHSLQVIAAQKPRFRLVSGAGIYGHGSPVGNVEGTRYASSHAGFLRILFPRAGTPLLSVLVVDRTGRAKESYKTNFE
jgi:hypothetical protein